MLIFIIIFEFISKNKKKIEYIHIMQQIFLLKIVSRESIKSFLFSI